MPTTAALRSLLWPLLIAPLALTACGSDDDDGDNGPDPALFPRLSCDDVTGRNACVQFGPTQVEALQELVNALDSGTTIILGSGTFSFDNQLTLRSANDIVLTGQGIDVTKLNFGAVATQSNGVDWRGDNFELSELTVEDASKDGVRIEDSNNIIIRRVKATWTNGPAMTNGAYGLYPVKSTNVLMEESEAWNASDAGIYVGQCQNVIVRNNTASQNVAGMEIENTQFADVYGNLAENNTGGLVAFDLPGNPIAGRDVKIHDNIIRNNNHENFAPSGTVRQIPAGTGTFLLASRRVEIYDNTYENNQTVDIAVLSGLIIEGDVTKWATPLDNVVGDIEGLDLDEADGAVMNFRTKEIYIHDNSHSGSGMDVDDKSLTARPLGALLGITYGDVPVDEILYDGVGESGFDPMDAASNTNDNHLCIGTATGDPTFATLNIPALETDLTDGGDPPAITDLYRPAAPFAPFDCTGFSGGDLADVSLPFAP